MYDCNEKERLRLKSQLATESTSRHHAAWALDTSKVDCDYYNFLRGDRSAFNSYRGEYMTQYSWAEVTRSALRQQAAATPRSGSIPSYYVPPTGF